MKIKDLRELLDNPDNDELDLVVTLTVVSPFEKKKAESREPITPRDWDMWNAGRRSR